MSDVLKHNNALYQWHPMAHPKTMQTNKPDIIARGEGIYIWDIDGHQMIDGVKAVMFGDGGSDAVEGALKIARQYWKLKGQGDRTKFISLRQSYHGLHFGGASVNGNTNFRRAYEPLLPGCFHIDTPWLYRNPYSQDPEELAQMCALLLERKIVFQGADTIAAFIAQPGQGAGGTMGADLALDVALALPLGVLKVVLSTVAHSHLIAPKRISPDLIMVLWAGGLYGLNSLCESALSQAACALADATAAAKPPSFDKPLVCMTSLGKSCWSYMLTLKPALEARGFEVVVFHSTGIGVRAFEALAAQGRFACVLDLCIQELANYVGGSCGTSGAGHLLGAGLAGVPKILAPGAADMVDFPAWQPVPDSLAGRSVHVHNRLIALATSPVRLRTQVTCEMVHRSAQATAHTALLMPLKGVEAWDKQGEPMHDHEGLQAFMQAVQAAAAQVKNPLFKVQELDAHINDAAFCEVVLAVFDDWLAHGIIA